MANEVNHGSATVAWFKLAELITRKEREKALSVYRLLAHSLENRAYALQLEGDILWSFDDKGASEKYKAAAFLYHKEKRFIDAIALYENLLFKDPQNSECLAYLVQCYAVIDWPEKCTQRLGQLLDLLVKKLADEVIVFKTIKHVVEMAKLSGNKEKLAWIVEMLQTVKHAIPENFAEKIHEII
jgi:tetratricopeptide (TPR) repeat protein